MQIDVTGKRNITLDFNAPRKFRLTQNGAEIPYIRTGKNSFRLSKDVDGSVELEEINEPIRLMQPVALQPQQMAVINTQDVDRLNEAVKQMALVNPADVLMINNAAEQLERTQNFIAEEQNKLEQSQIYLDSQQQKLNESAVNIQALETNNAERLDNAEVSIYNIAEDLDTVKTATLDNINSIDSLKAENLITQATLETKADKVDVDKIKEELEEYKDDNESFKNALSNYSGGLAVEYSVSEGGKDGQILTKITDETGVYGWKDPTPVIVKSKVIPTATEKLKGEVYQYVGETGDYIHGYIYECQKIGNTYQWIRLDVQPNDSEWGKIRGNISDQTDLQTALNGKQDKLSTTQMEAVNSGANTTNIGQIITNQNNITSINDKIPTQASSSNQLADKDFVNSSIATNTANFIGTFSSISDLESYSGTVTNNDYAFVINREVKDNGNDWATFADLDLYDKSLLTNWDYAWVINGNKFDLYRFDIVTQAWDLRATNIHKTDVTLNTAYNRYKAAVLGSVTWTFEYTLNNSSFTASQWSAINSGITSGLVAEFEAKGASLAYASDILTLKDSSGNDLSSVTIQASAQVDNKSITKNSSDQLQTVGVINQNDTTTALKSWSGTKAQYDAIVTKDANTLYNVNGYGVFIGTTQIAAGSAELNNPYSLLDYKYSEYELSNASWLLSNGQWNSGAVYQSVYDLLLQIYNGTTTKAGVSVKLSTETYTDTDFVLNTTDTTFRLPLKVALASSKAVAGNGMTLGLTNGSVNVGMAGGTNDYSQFFSSQNSYGVQLSTISGSPAKVSGRFGVTTDPTKSGIETSANGLYLYFYVGETMQDANIIAAASVLTDIADLKNASNFSSLGKETIVGWGMPDYSAGVSFVSGSTVQVNGWMYYFSFPDADRNTISIDNVNIMTQTPAYYNEHCGLFPVSAGQIVSVNIPENTDFTFYPCKGVN